MRHIWIALTVMICALGMLIAIAFSAQRETALRVNALEESVRCMRQCAVVADEEDAGAPQ